VSSVVIVANADAELRQVVSSLLHDGYDAQGPMGPLDALRWCSAHRPAALLVDVELRDLSAAEFCGVVRGRPAGARIPILLFGGPAAAPMAPEAAGADAYVSAADVLTLHHRLQTLVGRAGVSDEDVLVRHYEGRHLRARFDRVEVVVDGVRVDLARRELALLQFLVTHPNRVLARSDITAQVWRNRYDKASRTIDTHIRRLRVKLRGAGRQIQTVPRLGYRFSED
jgi:DNA-binding response OmpR family regulator